jgi:hypothetical protein
MKKIIPTLMVLVMTLSGFVLNAQQKETITDNASWQLVSNVQDKSKVTVQFFTKEGILMYEETLYNVKLNLNKKKTIRHLNAVLKEVYTTWVNKRVKTTETDLIAKKMQ